MGIVGYSRILDRLGERTEAEKMLETARKYATSLLERAENKDGSYRLAFDCPETFSLKYNAIWDKIWGTGIFPERFLFFLRSLPLLWLFAFGSRTKNSALNPFAPQFWLIKNLPSLYLHLNFHGFCLGLLNS